MSTTDPDAADTAFTYTFVNDSGYPDNAKFQIVGSQLQTNAIFDYETDASYDVMIRATGPNGLFIEEPFTVTVNDVNDEPVLAAIGAKSVVNTGTLAFTASATDQDLPAQTLTFSLINSPVTATINATTGAFSWSPTVATDAGIYYATVCVSDGALEDCETITITVTDGEAPTIVSGVAHGVAPYTNVTADSALTFTVPQGYVVSTIDFTISEPVTIVGSNIVYLGTVPYGTMTVVGDVVTVTPYAGNEIAAQLGTVTFNIDADSIEDLAGNALTTLSATLVVTDQTNPVMEEVLPAEGAMLFGPDDTFVLTVDAADLNLYELEIDHILEADPTLPEFSVYASETDPYGGDGALFAAAGVTVDYDAMAQVWTIDFGPTITDAFIANGGITFYMVLKDEAGNQWGSMSPTTADNTYVYTIELDDVVPVMEEVLPAEGAMLFGPDDTLVLTVDALDLNLYELEIDHSLAASLPEFSVYADALNPWGTPEDQAAFAAAGVTVSYDAGEQVWTIDFGPTITDAFIANGGITFYMVLYDEVGNQWGTMYGTTPENTYIYTITLDDVAPIMEEVLPAEGALLFGPDDTLVLTVDALDLNLYELEIDHSLAASLPEFSVYADALNPWGTPEDQAAFAAAGVTVSYDAGEQVWTIDFGPTITDAFIANGGITFYMVLYDEVGNQWGTMYGTTPENTYIYTITLDDVAPIMEEVLPAEGALLFGPDDTFVLTVDALDLNLYELEIDHSLAASLPEFSVYADALNPWGTPEDQAAFAAAGVTVSYDAGEQVWTIDFGPTITDAFIANGGITFYMVLYDEVGNQWGTMYGTTPENTYIYTITLDDVAPVISTGVAKSGTNGDVNLVDGKFTVPQGFVVDTIDITMDEPVQVALGTIVTMVDYGPYGTVTAHDGALITITPYTGYGTAELVGTFTFTVPDGSVTDLVGNEFAGSIILEVLDVTGPVVDITAATADGELMDGDLATGYILPTTNDPDIDHLLQITATVDEPLADDYFGLYFVEAESTVTAEQLKAYYAAKPVPSTPLDFLGYLNGAADGDNPFVYIKEDLLALSLVDAAKHDLMATDDDMTVPDTFPLGTYVVRGVLLDEAGNETTVTLTLIVTGDRVAPVLTITGAMADGMAMGGTLQDGYILITNGVSTLDRQVQFADGTNSSEPLADEYFGLKLINSTVSAADLKAYYAARGVPTPYLEYLTDAVDGINPFVYIKGTTIKLVDAAKHDIAQTDDDMTIPDDFPVGTYTVQGVVTDAAGNETTVTLKLIVVRNLVVTDADLFYGTDPLVIDQPLDGTFADGFVMELDPTMPWYYLDTDMITANNELAEGMYPFYLAPDDTTPIFYVKVDETGDLSLIDGYQYLNEGGVENPLRINGDFTPGTYTYTGQLTDIYGSTAPLSIEITFVNALEITDADLFFGTDPLMIDQPLGGDFENGFTMVLDPAVAYYYLDTETITANNPLEDGSYPFYLSPDTTTPIFYVKVEGTTYTLIDGYQYLNEGGVENPLRINGDFTPGTYTYTGSLTDIYGSSAPVSIEITFNDVPYATAQSVTVVEDTATAITLSGVDLFPGTMTYAVVTEPTHGTLSGTAPALTYTPAADYHGSDSFTFTVSDGTLTSAPATVTITVTSVLDVPTVSSTNLPGPYMVGLEQEFQVTLTNPDNGDDFTNVLARFRLEGITLADIASFQYLETALEPDAWMPLPLTQDGTAVIGDFGPATGFPMGVPYSATSQFKVTFNTPGTYPATIILYDVNADPDFELDRYEADVVVVAEFEVTEVDLEASTNIAGPYTVLPGTLAGGFTMVLDPAVEWYYFDTDTITSTRPLADGSYPFYLEGTTTEIFTLVVNGTDYFLRDTYANDGTPLRVQGNFPLGEYTYVGVVEDENGFTDEVSLTITFVAPLAVTEVALVQSTDLSTWTPVDGNLADGYAMNLDTTVEYYYLDAESVTSNRTLADGSYPFFMTANPGAEFFAYWADRGVVEGATDWQALMWPIINGDAPMFYLKVEGSSLSLIDGLQGAPNPLRVNGGYYPGLYGFTGVVEDTFGFEDELDVSILFNDIPVAEDQTVTTDEDTAVEITLVATDVDGDELTYAIVTGPANGTVTIDGKVVTYTPAENYNGTDSFTFKANDGTVDSNVAKVTITITAVNDAPVLGDLTNAEIPVHVAYTFTAKGTDIDSTTLTFSLKNAPEGAAIGETTGVFTWTPGWDDLGPNTFKVCVSDGDLEDCKDITLTVTNVNTLDEEIESAPGYTYPDGFEYEGVFEFEATENVYTVTYKPAQVLAGKPTADIARYLGALYRQDGATINGITFNGVEYTWKFNPPSVPELKGSNWRDADNKTLVSAITAYMTSPSYDPEAGFTITVTDGHNTETVTFIMIITNTLDAEIGSGFDYEYADGYTYVGTREFDDPNNIYTVTYDETQVAPHAMRDLARYLGALYRQDDATIIAIAYKGTTYTWNAEGTLLGSNWEDEDGNTLVSVITAEFVGGHINPAVGIVLTVADGIHTETVTFKMVIGNVAPVAKADAYETDEDVTLTVAAEEGVLANDTDVSELTAVLVEGPANGTLTLNADGSFVYKPNANFNGTDTFTYKAFDDELYSEVATVTITVTAVNDAPVAEDQAVTTDEDTAVEITLVATDVDGDTLTYAIVTAPTNGTITIVDNVVTYTPNANWHGADSFTFKANDGTVDSNIATVTITVKDVKDDVVANDDAYSVIQGKVLTVAAPGVLANDEDIDENNMSALLKTPPTNGTVVLLGDGSFVYTPNPEFSGEDTFVYTLKTSPGITGTGAWQADATVTITVYGKPVISSDDIEGPYYVGYEQEYHMKLANPAGGKTYNPVQVEIFAGNIVLDDIETIKVEHPAQAGEWIDLKPLVVADAGGLRLVTPIVPLPIEPDKDYTLTFRVTFKTAGQYPVTGTLYYYPDSDGTDHGDAVAVADFSSEMVVLKDIPVAVDDAYQTDEDVTLTVAKADGVLKNDTLNAPGTLSAVLVETVDAAHGTLTFAADGSFEFVPVANWHGTATFTYKATDGKHESAPATVTIVVKDVKDPVQAVDDVYETNEDTVLTVEAPGVLFNDIDVDLNNQYAYIKSNPTHGTVDLNPNGSFVYTPDADFHGEDVFEYTLVTTPRINDDWVDSAKVTITVKPVNDAPVLDPVTNAEIPVNVAYTFTASGSDVDGDTLSFSLKNAPEGAAIGETTGVFTWTPGWDDLGPNTFKVCVSDGDLEDCKDITLTVTNVNTLDEEIESAPGYTYPDGFEYEGVFEFEATENVYTVTYKPAQVLAGKPTADIARYLGALYRQDGATINGITFNGVEYTWKFNPPSVPELKGSNWRDADNKTLVSAITAYMTSPSYDPEAGFTITVTDGHNTETVTFIMIITNTLDAEIGSGFDYEYADGYTYVGTREFDDPNNIYTVTYDETQVAPHAMRDLARYLGALYRQDDATIIAIAYKGTTYTWNAEGTLLGSNWEDEDGNTLVSVITAAFLGGAIDPAVGIVLTVADGIHTETVTFKMVITNVAPELDPIEGATIPELVEYTFTETASDVPTATLTFSLVGAPEGAMIDGSTGVFTWTPSEAQGPAEYTFTVKVCDDGNPVMCDEQELTLNVTEVNLPPVLAEIGDKTVVATEELTFTATATDEDIPVQTLTFSLKNAPAGAEIDGETGVFTWTPTAAQVGEHSFEVCVTDGVAEVCEEITVTVTESVVVNLPPVAVADAYETNEDVALTIAAPGVLTNDIDPNGDAITAVLVTGPEHGTLALAADGGFVYTPNDDWNGTDTFTYKASDGTLESEDATVTITVKPVNDAPVAVDDAYTVAEDTLLSIAAPGVLANDSDIDGDVLNATVRTNPSHGALTLKGDGSFTYMPDADWNGTDTFTYTLVTHPGTNSEWTDWATVTITVTPVNDAPVLDPIPNATIPEMVAYTFTATASDVDSTNLTFSLVGAPAGAAINASTGVFTWTPTEAQGPQVYTFTVKVCDDATPSLCDQQSVKLTVTEVNRAPEIEDIEDKEVTVGEELTFTAVASDPDLPANTLTFRLEEAPAGAAIDPTTGKFTWTPVESQIGEHQFHVCVTDGQLNTCTLVKVTVKQGHVNTPPVAVADTYAVDQDQVLTIAAPGVLANDTDADNDTLTAILVSTTSNGTLTFNVDGSFVYTPRAEYFGTDTFTYKANDGKADSNVVTVTITVRKVEPVMPYQMYYPVIFQGW